MLPDKKYLWIITGAWALIFLPHLDLLYVNIMEARNFTTSREMLSENYWLLPTLNLEPRYEKPPMPTWLTAISGMIFGFSHFALRLPAALVSLLLLIYFYRFSLLLKISEKQSFLGSLILATSFYIIFMGRNGQWDIFTHAFMLLSVFYLWRLFSISEDKWKNAFLGGIFLGCSILSKGPVSLYALLLPFLLSYASVYKFKQAARMWKPLLLFLLIGLITGLWWFLYVRLADPEAFIKITTKEAIRWTNYNVRPFYYYWSFFTQSGIWTIPAFVALLYPYLKNRVSNKKAYRFSLFWTLIAVVLLSVIPEKKSRYLLPVLIPMALNTGFYVEYLFRRFRHFPLKEKWIVYLNHGIFAILGICFPVVAYLVLELESFWIWYILTSVTLFAIGAAMLYYLKKQNYPVIFYLSVAFICGIMNFGFPLSEAFLNNPEFRSYSELREDINEEEMELYLYKDPAPEVIWDYGSAILILSHQKKKKLKGTFGLLIREEDTLDLKHLQPDYHIEFSERYDLNKVPRESPGYKDRLVRRFYVLERK